MSPRGRARCGGELAALLAVVGALAACGSSSDSPAEDAPSPASPAPVPAPERSRPPSPDPSPPGTPQQADPAEAQTTCSVSLELASELFGEPAEEIGACWYTPVSVPGFGLPEYVGIHEQAVPTSISAWREVNRARGTECPAIVERPDLGPEAYEEHCTVSAELGGGQRVTLRVPRDPGLWALSVEMHSARATSEFAAADLLHQVLAALQ